MCAVGDIVVGYRWRRKEVLDMKLSGWGRYPVLDCQSVTLPDLTRHL